jgi:hypothetical protein
MVKKDLLILCKGIPVFSKSLLSLLKHHTLNPKMSQTSGIFVLLFSILLSVLPTDQVQSQSYVACDDHKNVTVSGDSCSITFGLQFLSTCLNPAIFVRPNGGTAYLNYSFTGTVNGVTYHRWPSLTYPGPVVAGRNYFIPASIIGVAGGPTWTHLNWQGQTPKHLKQFLGVEKRHIYECATGVTGSINRCWGTFSLEDKLAPVMQCPGNITVECADARLYLNSNIKSTSLLRRPTIISENCGVVDSTLTIEDKRKDCGGYLVRNWTYTDCGGMKGICSDTIFFTALTESRRMCPDQLVVLKCNDGITPDDIYNAIFARVTVPSLPTARDTFIYRDTTALKQAYPFFKTAGAASFDPAGTIKKLGKLEGVCTFITSYSDQIIYPCGNTCNSTRKIVRLWTVLDWCSGTMFPCTQVINATNTDGPTIVASDLTVSVDPWTCSSNFTFPPPTILHDVCDANPKYTVRGPLGVTIRWDIPSKRFIAIGVLKGVHTFTYVGLDCCNHESYDEVTVTVLDKTPPVAVAKQNIIISLTTGSESDGIAKLYTNSVDNGSYDSCTPVHLELRREEDPTRDNDGCGYTGNKTYNADGHPNDGSTNPTKPDYDPDNGEYVKFCCDDITNFEGSVPYGIVKVWMRVWDDGDMDGVYGSSGDNYNETWVNVRVEDKLTPIINCPPPVTINCDDDEHNLAVTGKATAYSNCLDLEVEYTDKHYLNNCKIGYIDRTWRIKNRTSVVCVQRITKVNPFGPFTYDKIKWPKDTTTNCANGLDTNKPTWTSGPCDVIGVSLKSDTFYFEGNACMKILNRWTVINWCQYDPNDNEPDGYYTHTQIIKVIDEQKPTLGSCADKIIENTSANCTLKDLVLTQTATDQGQCASNWLKWIVFVDLWGDGTNDYEYSSFLPSTDATFNDSNGNGIKDVYVSPTGQGGTVRVTLPEDVVGNMSNHKVTWKVVDGCGNVTACTQNIIVVDKKKPTPYCLNISSALMKNGKVELWAVDFNVGSFDNCTIKPNLIYTFNEASPVATKIAQTHYFKGNGENATEAEYNAGNAQKWIPATKSSGMVFDCGDLPSVDVKLTVWDEKGNYDFCVVKLNLADNQGACNPNANTTVSGSILTSAGKGLSNTEVILDNGIAEMLKTTTTNSQGGYTFNNTIMKYDYTIASKKNDDYLNGVSTLDLVMIQRHILAIEKLNGPYNIIAADANGDTKVTANDLLDIRKLILGVTDKFPGSDSWKFIDKHQTFVDANNPWPLTEKISIANLSSVMSDQNFVAVKVGDVNGSAITNVNSTSTESRSTVELVTENKALAVNESHSIVCSANADVVYGMQFTLTLNNADLLSVYVGGKKLSDSNIAKIGDNKYTMSWNDNNAIKGNEIITFNIVSKVNAKVSELVALNSNITSAEVYTGEELKTNKLSLKFGGNDSNSEFALFQNEPNPFHDKTNISFYLPEAGDAALKVFDVTGKVVYSNKRSFGKGLNSFTISRNDLPSTGVMIYQVESGLNVQTKKMIGLE